MSDTIDSLAGLAGVVITAGAINKMASSLFPDTKTKTKIKKVYINGYKPRKNNKTRR
jgi:hypothetical protein